MCYTAKCSHKEVLKIPYMMANNSIQMLICMQKNVYVFSKCFQNLLLKIIVNCFIGNWLENSFYLFSGSFWICLNLLWTSPKIYFIVEFNSIYISFLEASTLQILKIVFKLRIQRKSQKEWQKQAFRYVSISSE